MVTKSDSWKIQKLRILCLLIKEYRLLLLGFLLEGFYNQM